MRKSLQSLFAFLFAIPIAILGGLIGLGGAEFRLPVLIGVLKRQAREAVTINLAVSLVTVIASLFIRLHVVSEFPLISLLPIIGSMIAGAMVAAFIGAGFASKISTQALERWIKLLLVSIGALLIIESFLPEFSLNLVDSPFLLQILVGVVAGILIGIVSSTLGVAGGELIIPTLIFIFGVGVKLAGTASLIISIPTVSIGLVRYFRAKALFDRPAFFQIIVPMAVGSIIGSLIGGSLLGLFSDSALKLVLGVILIISALRMFMHQKRSTS